ncbi:MAG: NusG domain II-containing protein [Lachnospiraceae bacterium]|nr:NusG domain II-containing protein [Lachnospiraceae bacterium]MDD7025783.1 NusG domain II-containing protein [Lachnospiraceae bacterium]MDY5699982.1 NusG domain II-containing protein [Lachnospiraceae bacterium]
MNSHKLRLKWKKGDFLAVGFVLVLTILSTVVFHFSVKSSPAARVAIYQNGELVKELPLNQDTSFTLTGDYQNEIQIRQGEVGIIKSDCPGADCVHSGWIHEAGRSIVCLPNRVELRIEGESEVDFVVK